MRADRVKIAKQDHMQLGICLCRVLQNFLDHELRPAVGIRAMPGVGGLGERCGLIAVDRRGRREDEFFAAEFLHDFENAQAGIEIVAVIGKRQADRFADSLEPCKVNDAGDGALGKNVAQRALVADINIVKRRAFAGDFLDAVEHRRGTVGEIICQHNIDACVQAGDRRMRANESDAAGQ